jgi:hypothetical protein
VPPPDVLATLLPATRWLTSLLTRLPFKMKAPFGGNIAEAGKTTSTVIPASRKRRRKGNPVVSDETIMYGYESSATLTTDRLHYKLRARPVVREGAPRRTAKQLSGRRKEKKIWSWVP